MGICLSVLAHTYWGWIWFGGAGMILSKYALRVYESPTLLILYMASLKGRISRFTSDPWFPQQSSRHVIAMAKNVYAICFYVTV